MRLLPKALSTVVVMETTSPSASTITKWLVPGDVVRVEIEGLGAIENTVIEEPEATTLI